MALPHVDTRRYGFVEYMRRKLDGPISQRCMHEERSSDSCPCGKAVLRNLAFLCYPVSHFPFLFPHRFSVCSVVLLRSRALQSCEYRNPNPNEKWKDNDKDKGLVVIVIIHLPLPEISTKEQWRWRIVRVRVSRPDMNIPKSDLDAAATPSLV